MKISICRTYTFEAAHVLPFHNGKCRRLHGHSYRLEVEVSGAVNTVQAHDPESGMVMDFAKLDEAVEAQVIRKFDHYVLNDVLDLYPTAENIAAWIFDAVLLPPWITMERVRVYETARSYAEVKRD